MALLCRGSATPLSTGRPSCTLIGYLALVLLVSLDKVVAVLALRRRNDVQDVFEGQHDGAIEEDLAVVVRHTEPLQPAINECQVLCLRRDAQEIALAQATQAVRDLFGQFAGLRQPGRAAAAERPGHLSREVDAVVGKCFQIPDPRRAGTLQFGPIVAQQVANALHKAGFRVGTALGSESLVAL
jgi:hypothetical protein